MTVERPQPLPAGIPSPLALQRIRLLGHVSLAITALVFIGAAVLWGEPYPHVGKLIVAHIVGGRAGNATIGLNSGFDPWFILFQSCMQDFIIMFYAFPIFATGLAAAEKWPLIGPALTRIHALAERYKSRLAPYGVLGLMLFVLFPFWSTGPLVGVVVGYLLGLRVLWSFSAVIVGNVIAVALWIFAFDFVNGKLLAIDENLPWIVAAAIIVASILGGLWHRWQRRRQAAASAKGVPGDDLPKKPVLPLPE